MKVKNLLFEKLILIIKGFFMGFAELIPGVSGGTIALISGIYYPLIDSIKSFNLDWLKDVIKLNFKEVFKKPHLDFLIPLVIGELLAIILFTKIFSISLIITKYPEYVYGIFFGLVSCSSILMILKLNNTTSDELLFLLIGILVGFYIITMPTIYTKNSYWFIYICGLLSIGAMLLPGISGSLVLLLLNKYLFILDAIRDFNIAILFYFSLGLITGLICFSRIISYLLSKYYNKTILSVTGIMISSLWIIWPFQERTYSLIEDTKTVMFSHPYLPKVISLQILEIFTLISIGILFIVALEFFQLKQNSS